MDPALLIGIFGCTLGVLMIGHWLANLTWDSVKDFVAGFFSALLFVGLPAAALIAIIEATMQRLGYW